MATESMDPSEQTSTPGREAGAGQAGDDRPRVLVVEDDACLRLALEHGLASEGLHVDVVADAETAVSRAAETRPAVILLDWILPGGDGGPSVCRRLRSCLPGVPVVMHTGLDDLRDRRAAYEAGAHAFVAKGASAAALAEVLRDAIAAEERAAR